MKKVTPIFLSAGIAIIGLALYRYYKRQVDFVKDIQYQITGLNLLSISSSQVSLEIMSRIFNASNVEATVRQMYLTVQMNGVKVGEINEVKDILILPNKSSNISFKFSFNPREIGKNILNLITLTVAAKDIILNIEGYVVVKSGFIETTIPFQYENNLKSLLEKR
jgi:LEA14-like dessication related protein